MNVKSVEKSRATDRIKSIALPRYYCTGALAAPRQTPCRHTCNAPFRATTVPLARLDAPQDSHGTIGNVPQFAAARNFSSKGSPYGDRNHGERGEVGVTVGVKRGPSEPGDLRSGRRSGELEPELRTSSSSIELSSRGRFPVVDGGGGCGCGCSSTP